MRKGFLYWLFSPDKKPYYLDDNNVVQEGNAATLLTADSIGAHLKHSPDGWKDVLVKYGRNIKYFGLFRDFTVGMKFKLDGAKIVKDLMWANGMETLCYLGISKLNRTVFPDNYYPWYTGELDFSKFVYKKGDVSISVMEGGLSKFLKAYENTVYDIPVDDDPQAVRVLMDGFPFTNKIAYTLVSNPDVPIVQEGSTEWNLSLATVTQEGSTEGVINQDTQQRLDPDVVNDWFMISETKSISVNLSGSFAVHCAHAADLTIRIKRISSPGSGRNTDYDIYFVSASSGTDYNPTFSETIDLLPGEKLFLVATVSSSSIGEFSFGDSLVNVNYDVTFTETMIKGLYLLRLIQKLVDKMSNGAYTASSTFLASLTDYIVTSGSAIRNHEGLNPTVRGSIIKTSLSDAFKAINSHWSVGLGIENNVLVIEQLSYFFKSSTSLNLGIVDDVSIAVAEDLECNTIKVGYPNQTYDEVNGIDEFNVTQQYTTPHTRIIKELDLVSPFRTDPTGIELTRLNLYGKDTTDNSADNDTFMININPDVLTDDIGDYHLLNRPAFDSITGLLHPDKMFNVLFSPKRSLKNNGPLLHSLLDYQDAYYIKFRTGEKNSKLSTTDGTEVITENADILIGDLPAKLFLPYYFTFSTKVPLNFPDLMKTNPYDLISFISEGVTYKGYLFDGGIKPATNDGQTWKLLAGPDNDMSNHTCVPAHIGVIVFPVAYAGIPYSYTFTTSGTPPITISDITAPAWLVNTPSGGQTFAGTPSGGDAGVGIPITFNINNACGTAPFTGTIEVREGARFDTATAVSGDALNVSEIANIKGYPGTLVTITLDTLTNTNGGVLKVNGSPAFVGNTFAVLLDGSGNGTLPVEINGVANASTIILGHFTITAVSIGAIGSPNSYQISKIF